MSAILSADDLNDFISPGLACIKPTVNLNKPEDVLEAGEVEIQIDEYGKPLEISKIDGAAKNLSPAQISLADCLACSGCITSAEEILVAQHSHIELIKALKENAHEKVFVASVSHQARASLAAAYELTVPEVDRLLVNLLVQQMGFTYVIGTGLGRKLSLLYELQNIIEKKESGFKGPLLSSICPGWVLYAEKTHPEVLLRISEVKSPQQITGCLLKTLASAQLGVHRSKIYHLSIMPCFDKKLESARPEQDELLELGDVDCVLTPKELVTLLEEYKDEYSLPFDVARNESVSLDEMYRSIAPSNWPFIEMAWASDSGSLSGGYGYNYLQFLLQHLCLKDPEQYQAQNFELQSIGGRNKDIYELRLMYGGQQIASSAIVNGFRNIQNLVRKLKPTTASATSKTNPLVARRKARLSNKRSDTSSQETQQADASKCDYVEIMACPNGCINGGGQISAPAGEDQKMWVSKALTKYGSIPMVEMSADPSMTLELLAWCREFCAQYNISESRLLKTWFHEVEQPTDQAAILVGSKW